MPRHCSLRRAFARRAWPEQFGFATMPAAELLASASRLRRHQKS
jgi:hypothetical protein